MFGLFRKKKKPHYQYKTRYVEIKQGSKTWYEYQVFTSSTDIPGVRHTEPRWKTRKRFNSIEEMEDFKQPIIVKEL